MGHEDSPQRTCLGILGCSDSDYHQLSKNIPRIGIFRRGGPKLRTDVYLMKAWLLDARILEGVSVVGRRQYGPLFIWCGYGGVLGKYKRLRKEKVRRWKWVLGVGRIAC